MQPTGMLSCFLIPSSCLVPLKENVNDSLLETVVKVFSCQGLVERERGSPSLRVSLFTHWLRNIQSLRCLLELNTLPDGLVTLTAADGEQSG